jgi:hypothetical protein
MPAKPKPKPKEGADEEAGADEEGEPEKAPPAPEPDFKKILSDLARTVTEQAKELKALKIALPKPTEEQDKAKQEEERLAKVKAEQDLMLADYKETLAEKFHITEDVNTLDEARSIMRIAKANKLGLTTMADQSKEKPAKPENKPIFDVSALLAKD